MCLCFWFPSFPTTATTRGELDEHGLQIDMVDEVDKVDKKQKPFGMLPKGFCCDHFSGDVNPIFTAKLVSQPLRQTGRDSNNNNLRWVKKSNSWDKHRRVGFRQTSDAG